MVPSPAQQAELVTGLAGLALVSTFVLMSHRSLTPAIRVYAFQSGLLAVIAFLVGWFTSEYRIWITAGITIALKSVAIPRLLDYLTEKLRIKRERESNVGIPTSLLVGGLFVVLAYATTRTLGEIQAPWGRATIGISLAIVLIGLFLMVSRTKAITQTLGLLVMENGMFLAALSLTYGMPLVVELGIAFDVLVAAIVLGILIFHIHRTFDTISTKSLESLTE